MTDVMPGAEALDLPGGPVGVVCTHGFMASPAEVRWLALHLNAQGHRVLAPRLPGHGTQPEAMAGRRWGEWLETVLDAYAVLSRECERVFLVGHSMGGVLSLHAAAQVQPTGVAALAAPTRVTSKLAAARVIWPFLPYTDQSDTGPLNAVVREEQARRGEATLGRVRYGKWSTRAVGQLAVAIQALEAALPRVTAPLLAVYSATDSVVPLGDRDSLLARVGSQQVETLELPESDHIMTQDRARETVFAAVAGFIGRWAE